MSVIHVPNVSIHQNNYSSEEKMTAIIYLPALNFFEEFFKNF